MIIPVEQHYSREQIFENILATLEATGIKKNAITRKDLAAFDEFHVRGSSVTVELAKDAGLEKNMKVLDVGCGIGGPCRLIAEEYGCITTGIDITGEFIRTATLLSELTGLQDRTHFLHASALQLPFATASFDAVWTQHVQMNIEDKKQFYSEIHRVLKPGGSFIYYDIFSINDEAIAFPVPWADTASLSHLITIEELHRLFVSVGFELISTTDQTPAGISFLQTMAEKLTSTDRSSFNLQLLVGDSLPEKMINLHKNFVDKKLVLESGIFRK
jgi:SAM-dependent methyltransferase